MSLADVVVGAEAGRLHPLFEWALAAGVALAELPDGALAHGGGVRNAGTGETRSLGLPAGVHPPAPPPSRWPARAVWKLAARRRSRAPFRTLPG